MSLTAKHLACGYHGYALMEDICFSVEDGEVACILGPNGVGKTTFFKTAQGFLPPVSGQIFLNGKSIDKLSRKEMARQVAYVPQAQGQPFDFTVYDMILMGRASFVSKFSSPSREDHDICAQVIEDLGIGHLKERLYTRISGGEQQLVLIARALVQQPRLLMMDEPTSNLDFGNQVSVLHCISGLSKKGIGILMITHSPDHALICADKIVLFCRDKRVMVGKTEDIITEETLLNAYNVRVKFTSVEDDNGMRIKTCVPLMKTKERKEPTFD